MVLPVLLAVGAGMASLIAVQGVAKVVVGAEFLDGRMSKKRKKELEREQRLSLNPQQAEFHAQRKRDLLAKMGRPSDNVVATTSFVEMSIGPDELEEDRKWMAGDYYLTEGEAEMVVDAMMQGITSIDIVWFKEISVRRRADLLLQKDS